MKYVIRKYVVANTVQEALVKEPGIPPHDCYLLEGETPFRDAPKDLIGFAASPNGMYQGTFVGEPELKQK